ncbi:type II toxin-antitoxin system VapC family toxin [Sphingomonas qilianensis]|uniref:PIN domain-containing protein n=1 Tax=Sphingomonas qilianensis TaxID=1736690 RepID=A0ABU9XTN0_9SPHN
MRLLIDTHFLSWLVLAPKKIGRGEMALMSRSDLLVSAASILELRIKQEKFARSPHRLRDLLDPAEALDYVGSYGLELLALSGDVCATALNTPMSHSDPFDELLLIHAQYLGVKLLTRDTKLLDHPLAISA